jgi:hypothetical protein
MAKVSPVRRYLGDLPGVLDLLRKEFGGCVAPRFRQLPALFFGFPFFGFPFYSVIRQAGQRSEPVHTGWREGASVVRQPLAGHDPNPHAPWMFVVTEAEAAAIRTAFDRGGELSAAVELRRLFPGITDTAQARECARTIAGWKPLPVRPRQWTRPSS